jgi:hypothetical protein
VNPDDIGPAFTFVPCGDGTQLQGCTQLHFTTAFFSHAPGIYRTRVIQEGSQKWIAMAFMDLSMVPSVSHFYSLVANLDGTVVSALRLLSLDTCLMSSPAVGAGHYALPFIGAPHDAGLIGASAFGTVPPSTETFAVVEPAIGAVGLTASGIGNGRTTFYWDQGRTVAADWNDGGMENPIYLAGKADGGGTLPARAAPDRFLFSVLGAPWAIWSSDGVALAQPYLASAGTSYGAAQFTGHHLAWLQGTNQHPDDAWAFDSIELWASPYAQGTTVLTPSRVSHPGAFPLPKLPEEFGGDFDWYAAPELGGQRVHAWHLPDGEHRIADIGAPVAYTAFGGVTADELVLPVWRTAPGKTVAAFTVYRIPFGAMTVVSP